MRSIMMMRDGGNEALALREGPNCRPGPGEVAVEVKAAGVNFMDIGVREGRFLREIPNPKTLGVEGAGVVRALGPGVTRVRLGQRVAWVFVPGSYADWVCASEEALVPIPEGVSDQEAASIMMQGLTASHFATEFYPVQTGDIALIHAAAGGVGTLLTQIVRIRGGRVIGRVSSPEKVAVAKAAGVDDIIVDNTGNFAKRVLELTQGRGVDVVFDGSGAETFEDSLASLKNGGTLCWYGTALDGLRQIDLVALPRSVKIGYAVFLDHIRTWELLQQRSKQLFQWMIDGRLHVHVGQIYPLDDAGEALAQLEARRTTGKLLLLP